MIKWLDRFRKPKVPEVVIPPEEPVDIDGIYYRLKMSIGRLTGVPFELKVKGAALGTIESFSETLDEFLKQLIEVNYALKENKHIDGGIFYIKNAKTVKFDRFLFVRNDYYVKDAPELLQRVLEQIDVYYEQMKYADKAHYGVVEHNHRQLYQYTTTIIHFLDSIFDHFGQ